MYRHIALLSVRNSQASTPEFLCLGGKRMEKETKTFRKTFGIIKNPLQVSDNEPPPSLLTLRRQMRFLEAFSSSKKEWNSEAFVPVEEGFCRPLLLFPQQGKVEKKEKKWENILLSLANRLTNYNKRILRGLLKTELKKRKKKKSIGSVSLRIFFH